MAKIKVGDLVRIATDVDQICYKVSCGWPPRDG